MRSQFGFGVINAEAMVLSVKYWTAVQEKLVKENFFQQLLLGMLDVKELHRIYNEFLNSKASNVSSYSLVWE